jgi:UDP-glucuronate decarboxylase
VAETLTVNYKDQGHVDTRIVRIFNTFGPRMLFNDGRVVSNFIVQALKGDDITVYGEGQQTRSFCYVDDLVKGIIATMNREGFHGPVNLGNPNEMTIMDLAKRVIELTGSKSKIAKRPLPQDDPTRRQPQIDLAKRELGWQPVVDLNQGLTKTIEDFSVRLSRGEEAR